MTSPSGRNDGCGKAGRRGSRASRGGRLRGMLDLADAYEETHAAMAGLVGNLTAEELRTKVPASRHGP
jgi:hypothetical protein